MSAYLHCDGPNCSTSSKDPAEVREWWRLERQGAGDIEEPTAHLGRAFEKLASTLEVHSTIDIHDGEDSADSDEFDEEDLDPVVLHFCSAACGSAFLAEAAAFE